MFNLFAQVIYLAADEEPEGIDLIIPETSELIAGIVAFSIVFLFVWLKGRPMINKALTARQEAITGQLTDAEKAKSEAEGLLDDYRKQLASARDEANEIVESARQSAESLRSEIVSKAETDAEEITRKARDDAASERDRAEAAIRAEVASLSLAIAEKVVASSVDEAAQRQLVDQYIDELGELGSE